jgi:hypothetical protein
MIEIKDRDQDLNWVSRMRMKIKVGDQGRKIEVRDPDQE